MYTDKYTYRGMVIYKNYNEQFNSPYFSIVNPRLFHDSHKCHCHCGSDALARKIIDCYQCLRKFGSAKSYDRNIRNKALRLDNIYITY